MLYFAYGSNMSVARMHQRIASAHTLTRAVLRGHRLAFRKVGRDGSAKCDAVPSVRPGDLIHGVLYRLAAHDKPVLDAHEGLGRGYAERRVMVLQIDGTHCAAFLYQATHVDDTLKPFGWYREHVLRGAREHRLPAAYIAAILSTETREDPDLERHRREMALYD
jgi:gamma-glutamylcyclotransferase (GGCT)/AIG2-like uncharacterized protein YtfP